MSLTAANAARVDVAAFDLTETFYTTNVDAVMDLAGNTGGFDSI